MASRSLEYSPTPICLWSALIQVLTIVPGMQDFFTETGNKEVSRMLSVQYRMNQLIMEWSSQVMSIDINSIKLSAAT